MSRLSGTILTFFTLILFSTIPVVSANQIMQNGANFIQIQQIDENEISQEVTPLPADKKPEKKTLIKHTKSTDGTKGFIFSISSPVIDFGEITPTNPLFRTNILSVVNYASPLFSVLLSEDHPPALTENVYIPDTSCDNGACSDLRSAPWNNTLSYGFGYRCDNTKGASCNQDFNNPDSYKRFPDEKRGLQMTDIMHGQISREINEASVVYKINTSSTQPQGSYVNTVTLIAVPGY